MTEEERNGEHFIEIVNPDKISDVYAIRFESRSGLVSFLDKEGNVLGVSIMEATTLARWLSTDPEEKTYPELNPYNFVANTPIQAIDPDGRLIIFINGFLGFLTGASGGGTAKYWSDDGSWQKIVHDKMGDYKAMYFDGSSGGLYAGYLLGGVNNMFNDRDVIGETHQSNTNPEYRRQMGYKKGKIHAKEIIANLKKDRNGKIIESVKFVTNSMGAAYQRGFSQALVDYVSEYNGSVTGSMKKIEGFEIEHVIDIAAFQGNEIGNDPNTTHHWFMRSTDDLVAGYETAKIDGAQETGIGIKAKTINIGIPVPNYSAHNYLLKQGQAEITIKNPFRSPHHSSWWDNPDFFPSSNKNDNSVSTPTTLYEENK